jgi:hypothetical protein
MPFLTCDNPVYYTGFQNPDIKLYFPISSKVCLFATKINDIDKKWKMQNSQFWLVDDKTIEGIRSFLIEEAVNEIYCSQKSEWLVKFINNRIDK